MKKVLPAICAFLLFSSMALAQGGLLTTGFAYSHKTGAPGNGFIGGAEFGLNRYVRVVGEISPYWSALNVASVRTSSNEQDFMFGGRFVIPNAFRNAKLVPFGQLLYGVVHTGVTTKTINGPETASDSASTWAWDFGGGVEYRYRPRWRLRGGVSLFKTHFSDASQTNAKFNVGISYCLARCGAR
jgi:hypothetical protein